MGKGEIARYEQILLFPQCFQKACFPGVSKGVILWEWVNPFPKKPWLFTCLWYRSLENTVGKGEIARNEQILLFPQCFQKACFPGVSKGVILWEWVNPFPKKPWLFTCLWYRSLENTVGKGEIARNEQFLLFPHSVFYSFG